MRELIEEADGQRIAREANRNPRNWPAELEAAKPGPQEKYLALLMEAMEDGYAPPGAETDLRARFAEVRRVADTLPRGNAVRGQALLLVSQVDEEEDPATRQAATQALYEEFRGAGDDAAVVKARIGVMYAHGLESGPERVAIFASARDAMRSRMPAGDLRVADAWTALADERTRQKDFAGAEAEWRGMLAWHATAPAGSASEYGLAAAQSGYMSFLMARGRWDDAEAVARPAVEAAIAQAAQGKRRALMPQVSKLQALFWISIQKKDAAQAARWLDAWERAGSTTLARHNPQLGLARLAAAEASGDAGAIQESRKKLAELATIASICKVWASDLAQSDALAPARKGVIERHGVCKPA
jgi:hypothetical protein